MEFGAFAFYSAADDSSSKKSHEILEQRIETIQNNAQEIVGEDFKATLHISEIVMENTSGWFAGCILVEHT
ncbi:MAG: hypothetical protein Q4A76_00815 [Porphyromonadaceae bacterium]|nr:hypothetical protein [Porphyromonadaceae bacterium]